MSNSPELRVLTRSGWIEGASTADDVIRSFKGVPYAAPPIGELRWRPPQPVAPWQGVRPATEFGPRCIQPNRSERSIGYFGPETESEDCLYLNIWTQVEAAREARRPVMVWIHGGAFVLGSGALPIFDGERLARAGVVFVTLNYRLGRLGFLAHPDLTRESDYGASGNYGLLDQIAALNWIKENIAQFGGDRDRVTVLGQSTGSVSVSVLMASPLARGLFHRAIGQSGARFAPPATTGRAGGTMQVLDDAERSGSELGRILDATTAESLRALPARTLQLARPDQVGVGAPNDVLQAPNMPTDTAFPIIDGHVLPDNPYAIFAAGRQNDVPLLTGSNANEGATMQSAASLNEFLNQSRSEFRDLFPAFSQLYAAENDDEAVDASQVAFGYRSFVWQNWTWANMQAQTGHCKSYYYRFVRVPPLPPNADFLEKPATKLGAFHGAEIPYALGNLHARNWPWQDVDHRLARIMSSYWVNFAAGGNPNGDELPNWPAHDGGNMQAMIFGDESSYGKIPDEDRLNFWDAYFSRVRGSR